VADMHGGPGYAEASAARGWHSSRGVEHTASRGYRQKQHTATVLWQWCTDWYRTECTVEAQ
jgi:hypothetical protein